MSIDIDPTGPLGYLTEKPVPQGPNNALGKDAFLKLLVAQMKYQNPMEPTDSTEFISQTAQFTLVEQMENMASSNAEMLQGQLSATAASLVGKHVQWNVAMDDETGAPGEGMVQGVRVTADGPVLIVDGWDVPLTRVTAFGTPPPEPAPPVTDDTTETDPTDETSETTETEPTEGTGTAPEPEATEPPDIPTDPAAPAA